MTECQYYVPGNSIHFGQQQKVQGGYWFGIYCKVCGGIIKKNPL